MFRARFLLLLGVLCALAFPSSALAIGGSFSGSAGSSGGGNGGGVGGGSGGNVNDVIGVNDGFRLQFESGWLKTVTGPCPLKSAAGVCKTKTTIYRSPSDARQLGSPSVAGHSINRSVAGRVAWTNTCSVAANVLQSSSCAKQLSGVSGNNSWAEVHATTPANTGVDPTQGPIVNASVRLWRECRHTSSGYTTAGSNGLNASTSGGCTVDPIFERVIPYSDGGDGNNPTRSTYFYQRRANGKNATTSDASYSAYNSLTSKASAGPLYGSCSAGAANGSAGRREFCRGGFWNNFVEASGSYYEDRCQNGAIATPARWSNDEIIMQARYMMAAKKPGSSFMPGIITWAQKDRAGSVWPPGVSHQFACEHFSEWIALDWTIRSGADGQKPAASVKLLFNGVPGRLYAFQQVYTDNRENIVQQNFDMLTGTASSAGTGCTPTTCPPVPGCPSPPCSPPPPPGEGTPGSVPPAQGTFTAEFPNAQMVGQKAASPIRTQPAESDSADNGGDPDDIIGLDAESGKSLWAPRTLKVSIYNPFDDSTGSASTDQARQSYERSHTASTIAGGEPFTTAENRPIIDPNVLPGGAKLLSQHTPLLANPDGTSGNDLSVRVANPTRSLPMGRAFDEHERAKAYETRFATLMGESHFPYSWEDEDANNYGTWERFTADACNENDILPRVELNGVKESCGDYMVRPGWNVSDAYRLPRTHAPSSAAVRMNLVVNFRQNKTGPAHLALRTSNPALWNFISANSADGRVAPQVWNFEDYMSRDQADQPTYRWQPISGLSASGQDRTVMNFCKPTLYRTITRTKTVTRDVPVELGVFAHRLNTWNSVIHGDWDGNGTTEDMPGRYTGPTFTGLDLLGTDRAFLDGGRFYAKNGQDADEKKKNGEWGRSWWGQPNKGGDYDAGTFTMWGKKTETTTTTWQEQEAYNNPDCQSGTVGGAPTEGAVNMLQGANNQAAYELPEGDYVIVFPIVVPAGQVMPAIQRWGVAGKVQRNPTMKWAVRFDVQQQYKPTAVYRTRTVG